MRKGAEGGARGNDAPSALGQVAWAERDRLLVARVVHARAVAKLGQHLQSDGVRDDFHPLHARV